MNYMYTFWSICMYIYKYSKYIFKYSKSFPSSVWSFILFTYSKGLDSVSHPLMDPIQPCCILDGVCFWEAAVRLWWKSLACLTQKVRLNCLNIYEPIYESWPWDLWMWHPLASVWGDLCLKEMYFWTETCVAATPFCENLSWRALQLDWFCFPAE